MDDPRRTPSSGTAPIKADTSDDADGDAALSEAETAGGTAAADVALAADADDDAPLSEAEAAAGSATADEALDETLDERVELVLEDLAGVTRRRDGQVVLLAARERVFAVLGPDLLEVALDPPIAAAALRTPDTRKSPRGTGWIAFTPGNPDRFALDRAEAWLRLGHRRAVR